MTAALLYLQKAKTVQTQAEQYQALASTIKPLEDPKGIRRGGELVGAVVLDIDPSRAAHDITVVDSPDSDLVNVTGTTKGRGYTGVITLYSLRYGFGVLPMPQLGEDIGLVIFRSEG